MRVLVVGGAGYIGGAVTDLLLARKIDFAVFDSLLYESHFLKPVPFVRGSVTDVEHLKSVLAGFTHVIWLAAVVGDAACAATPDVTKVVNQLAVKWLSEMFKGRIIFMSTCSVYGEHHGEVGERGKTKPLSLYAQTKLEAESYLTPKNALILRLGTVFGLSDTYSRPRMDLVGNQMPVSALTRGIIEVHGGGQYRPMIHVRDVAAVIVKGLDSRACGIYNIALRNVTMSQLAAVAAMVTGAQIQTLDVALDGRDYQVSTKKAEKDFVMRQEQMLSLEFGMRQFVTLIQEGRLKDPASAKYFNARHLKGE